MKDNIHEQIHSLSSKSVMKRKLAIKELMKYLGHKEGHLARLSLHYVSEHDPCYTVRNIARQAFYRSGMPPEGNYSWEKTHFF